MYNLFNTFNNQILIFNSDVELVLIHVYMINVLTKHVNKLNWFIYLKINLKWVKFKLNSLNI